MKKLIQKTVLLFIILYLLYSCGENPTNNTPPFNYQFTAPILAFEHEFPYSRAKNRAEFYSKNINGELINGATVIFFEDNNLFRNIGSVYLNKLPMKLMKIDSLISIREEISILLDFGYGYYKDIDIRNNDENMMLSFTLDENQEIIELDQILKPIEFVVEDIYKYKKDDKLVIKSNNTNGELKFRLKILSEKDSVLFYGRFEEDIIIDYNLINLHNGKYNLELIAGIDRLDTLKNNELFLSTIYYLENHPIEIVVE